MERALLILDAVFLMQYLRHLNWYISSTQSAHKHSAASWTTRNWKTKHILHYQDSPVDKHCIYIQSCLSHEQRVHCPSMGRMTMSLNKSVALWVTAVMCRERSGMTGRKGDRERGDRYRIWMREDIWQCLEILQLWIPRVKYILEDTMRKTRTFQ